MSWIFSDKDNTTVIANIPRYGLCNCLLVWAKAYTFAQLHGFPLVVHGWHAWHIGPWIRGERVKRYYGNYFIDQRNFIELWRMKFCRWRSDTSASGLVELEPKLDSDLESTTRFYVFEKVPHRDDFFAGLRGNENMIREGFFAMLRPWIHKAKQTIQKPNVAIHVRRGDYHASGHKITPIEYYVNQLKIIREINKKQVSAVVFSDAHDEELKALLDLPNVSRSQTQPDILDLVQMITADTIVTSLQSTFGYWAGYLSKASVILHPDHRFGRIRAASNGLFEGTSEDLLRTSVAS